jgi:hypothetical protein
MQRLKLEQDENRLHSESTENLRTQHQGARWEMQDRGNEEKQSESLDSQRPEEEGAEKRKETASEEIGNLSEEKEWGTGQRDGKGGVEKTDMKQTSSSTVRARGAVEGRATAKGGHVSFVRRVKIPSFDLQVSSDDDRDEDTAPCAAAPQQKQSALPQRSHQAPYQSSPPQHHQSHPPQVTQLQRKQPQIHKHHPQQKHQPPTQQQQQQQQIAQRTAIRSKIPSFDLQDSSDSEEENEKKKSSGGHGAVERFGGIKVVTAASRAADQQGVKILLSAPAVHGHAPQAISQRVGEGGRHQGCGGGRQEGCDGDSGGKFGAQADTQGKINVDVAGVAGVGTLKGVNDKQNNTQTLGSAEPKVQRDQTSQGTVQETQHQHYITCMMT